MINPNDYSWHDEAHWLCPVCGIENIDFPARTVFPMCWACQTWDLDWNQLNDEKEKEHASKNS